MDKKTKLITIDFEEYESLINSEKRYDAIHDLININAKVDHYGSNYSGYIVNGGYAKEETFVTIDKKWVDDVIKKILSISSNDDDVKVKIVGDK